jgi:hypothetical protein
MNYVDCAIIAICMLLLINKATREGAFILISAKVIYSLFIIDRSATLYYSLTAALNIVAGMFLQHKYKLAAICAYVLVAVNVLGFYLWVNYYPPDLYNVISVIIIIIQLIAISTRLLTHGRTRDNNKYPLAFPHGFNSNKACDTMYKTASSKKQ